MQKSIKKVSAKSRLIRNFTQGEILDEVFHKLRKSSEVLDNHISSLKILEKIINEVHVEYKNEYHIRVPYIQDMIELPDESWCLDVSPQCILRITVSGEIILYKPFVGQIAQKSIIAHPHLVDVMDVIFSTENRRLK
jgi:hypothetical protein